MKNKFYKRNKNKLKKLYCTRCDSVVGFVEKDANPRDGVFEHKTFNLEGHEIKDWKGFSCEEFGNHECSHKRAGVILKEE